MQLLSFSNRQNTNHCLRAAQLSTLMLRGIVQTGRATALSPVCASSWATARAGARARSFSGRTVKSGKVANPEAVKPAAGAGEKADNAAGGFKLEDAVKYFRRGLVVLGGSFFVFKLARDYHNPQSWLSQALYSGVSRPKYTLQIEDLKDRLAGYNTAIIAASRGPREARQFQAERMALKRLSQMSGAVEMREELAKAVLACQQLNGEITKLSIERRELMMPFHRQLLRGSKKKEGESTTDNTGESFQKALEKSAEISKQIDQKEIELSKTIIESLSPEKRQEMEARDMLPAVLNMVRTLLSSGAMDHDKSLGSIANRRRPRGKQLTHLLQRRMLSSSLMILVCCNLFFLCVAYVLQFRGDIMASQVALLREEITAILTSFDVSKSDTVVIMLNSGGGTVTGYGLAAAQLQRVKDAGLKLVVCVDEVAAR